MAGPCNVAYRAGARRTPVTAAVLVSGMKRSCSRHAITGVRSWRFEFLSGGIRIRTKMAPFLISHEISRK